MVGTYTKAFIPRQQSPTLLPGVSLCMDAMMIPMELQIDNLPSAAQDCVVLYQRVGEVANDMRGAILRHIRDNKIYKQSGHKSFEAFIDVEFNLSRRRAYELISDYEVRANLCASGAQNLPATERATRPLAKLPADEQADAWEEVVIDSETTGKKITAKKVEQVVAKRKGAASSPHKETKSDRRAVDILMDELEQILKMDKYTINLWEARRVLSEIRNLV